MIVLYCLVLFLAAAANDVVWARWTLAVNELNEWKAGVYGGGIFILGAIGITAYVSNPLLLIPVALGGVSGTVVEVRRKRKAAERAAQ